MASAHFRLIVDGRLLPFLMTHLQGIFGSHLFKTAMLIVLSFHIFPNNPSLSSRYAMIGLALFALPHLLLAPLAGQLADQIDKVRLLRVIKGAEMLIMMLALLALQQQSLPLLLSVLLLIGAKGTVLAALQFSLPPQLLQKHELIAATGLLQSAGVIALLTGQMTGALVSFESAGLLLFVLSAAGFAVTWLIRPAPTDRASVELHWSPFAGAVSVLKPVFAHSRLRTATVGISWFYVVGAIFTGQIPTLVRNNIGGEPAVVSALLTMFVAGTVGGAILVHYILRGEISARLLPIGAAIIAISTLDFGLGLAGFSKSDTLITLATFVATSDSWRLLLDLLVIGAAASIMVVPLYAMLQTAGPPERRGRDVAANNIVNAVAVIVATALVATAVTYEVSVPAVFMFLGAVTFGFALAAFLRRCPSVMQTRNGASKH